MAVYVGLDVSLKTTSICVIEADGTPVWQGRAESEPVPLLKALSRWQDKPASSALAGITQTPRPGEVIKQELGGDVLHKQRHSKRRKRRGRR